MLIKLYTEFTQLQCIYLACIWLIKALTHINDQYITSGSLGVVRRPHQLSGMSYSR